MGMLVVGSVVCMFVSVVKFVFVCIRISGLGCVVRVW